VIARFVSALFRRELKSIASIVRQQFERGRADHQLRHRAPGSMGPPPKPTLNDYDPVSRSLDDLPPLPAQFTHLGNSAALEMAIRLGMGIGIGMMRGNGGTDGGEGLRGNSSVLDMPLEAWVGAGAAGTMINDPSSRPTSSRRVSERQASVPIDTPTPSYPKPSVITDLINGILSPPLRPSPSSSTHHSRRGSSVLESESNPSTSTSSVSLISPVTGTTSPTGSISGDSALDDPYDREDSLQSQVWKLYEQQHGGSVPKVDNLSRVRPHPLRCCALRLL
jgi:hypothetical protein